ncbi:MAG: hypothetical protein B6D77_04875 [gamma proteobacterium symbiont of Ctena orbiculata]|nr:MAG: hypothetical protein B6D77_04875 [gamma proteobacterium symbiont of Ctena orbiculata]
MHSRIIGALLILYSGTLLAVDEHVACQHPNAYADYDADTLHSIARSCKVSEVADLYYHRASHIRQLEKYLLFEHKLNNLGDSENIAYIDTYRIHIGLAEALLSKVLAPDAPLALNRLNRIYERSGEIAELRFRGYDLIANRLQQWLREKSNI